MRIMNLSDNELRQIARELGVPDEVQYKVFMQYYKMVKMVAEKDDLNNILEIGSGFSTIFWGMLSEERNINVYTLDLSFTNLFEAVNGTPYKKYINNINLLEGLSVSANETNDYYDNIYTHDYFGFDWKNIVENSMFIDEIIDRRRSNHLKKKYHLDAIVDIKTELANNHKFLEYNLDYYSNFGSFKKELDLLSKREVALKGDVMQKMFDVIFFDSGELASNVEFMKLFNKVNQGGYVCLHDIYYPKSFKNWLPCTVYQLRKDYKQVYIDSETSQGMYIVKHDKKY